MNTTQINLVYLKVVNWLTAADLRQSGECWETAVNRIVCALCSEARTVLVLFNVTDKAIALSNSNSRPVIIHDTTMACHLAVSAVSSDVKKTFSQDQDHTSKQQCDTW